MRIRWHKWWLVALASTACTLNPQPDLPGDKSGGTGSNSGGAGGSINISVPGGSGTTSTGDSGGLPTAAAGGSGAATPDAGLGEAGAGGAPDGGSPGDTPVLGQGGVR